MNSTRENNLTVVLIVLFVLLLVATAIGGYFFIQYQKANKIINNPQQLAKSNSERIMMALRNVYVAPDEEPTIATVVDKSKLPSTPFFAAAQNGDQIIAFPKAKTAVLFRPGISKVVSTTFLESVPEQRASGTEQIDVIEGRNKEATVSATISPIPTSTGAPSRLTPTITPEEISEEASP